MENLDLREILKDVPKGTKLYSPLYGECSFYRVNNGMIELLDYTNKTVFLYYNGKYQLMYDGECMLFPSKEQRDWSKFELPCQFKVGDVLTSKDGLCIAIFNKSDFIPGGKNPNVLYYNCWCSPRSGFFKMGIDYGIGRIDDYHYATETEKNILFNKLQEKGYFWNDETNSLELYKFKISDKIQDKSTKKVYTIYGIDHDTYITGKDLPYYIPTKYQNQYELYQEKFDVTTLKPYDKVLVRCFNDNKWAIEYFEGYVPNDSNNNPFYCMTDAWKQCIPYKGNEHLVRTTNDCDEYYKTWE